MSLTGKEFLSLEESLQRDAKYSDMMCYQAQSTLPLCELVRDLVRALRRISACHPPQDRDGCVTDCDGQCADHARIARDALANLKEIV